MKRNSIYRGVSFTFFAFLLSAGFAVLLSGCGGNVPVDADKEVNDQSPQQRPGSPQMSDDEFEISLGETITLESLGLRITFDAVLAESRCPVDVVCVTAGEATISMTGASGQSAPTERIVRTPGFLQSPDGSDDRLRVGTSTFQLVSLLPLPNTSEPPEGPYRATFRVID